MSQLLGNQMWALTSVLSLPVQWSGSPEQTWSPLTSAPFSFSGVQSTLYTLSPLFISFCISLQQLSGEMLTKQQLGWITSCAGVARQDQHVFLQASPWVYSCGEKFTGSPVVCWCTGPTGSSLCLWKSWGELHLCFEKGHWVTASKSSKSMGGRRMWRPIPEANVGGGVLVGPQLLGSNCSSVWLKTLLLLHSSITAVSQSPRTAVVRDKLAFL